MNCGLEWLEIETEKSEWEAFLGIDNQDDVLAIRNGKTNNGHYSMISGIVYHPDWENVLYRADIALMKMEVPVLEYSGTKKLGP